jgi:hypothetical protein
MDKDLFDIQNNINSNLLPKYPFLKNYIIEPMNYEQDMDYIWDNYFGYYEPFSVMRGEAKIRLNYFNEKLKGRELYITILHEIYHAIQEFLHLPLSESQAEIFAQRQYKRLIR